MGAWWFWKAFRNKIFEIERSSSGREKVSNLGGDYRS